MLSTTAPLPLPAGGAQSMPGCDHGPRPQAARQSAALGGHLGRGHGGRAAILAEGGAGPGPGRRERPALGRAAAKGREVRPVRAGGRGGASRRARIREVRPQNVRFGRREWGRGAKILHRNPELSVGRRAKGFVHSQLRGAVAVAAPAAEGLTLQSTVHLSASDPGDQDGEHEKHQVVEFVTGRDRLINGVIS
ncbi:uncharacterized protein LOC110407645 isoform X4 [Numida meleagris]|uniref:uncharacterized protein LOC110407645 isoform X4 n=1 Tax=Numida meleagris TaxID=8996 RepID=UPI000B3E2165|nr:uncharacterized protein LOC110407645 isoform X4 [Numida meleagris]